MIKSRKIKQRSEIADIVAKNKAVGKISGFTNGCFDIIHVGHVKYLTQAKSECDTLIIGVNSDSSVRRLKGPTRPVNGQDARMEVLAALECVDFVTLFEEDTPEMLVRSITPDILFKGGDWTEEKVVGGDHVRSHGGKVRIVKYEDGFSTTSLIDRIKDNG